MNSIEDNFRILQVHNYYQIPGGEDTVVANEKKVLEDNGHTVIQYTRDNRELHDFSTIRKLLLPITTIFNLRTYKDVKKLISENNIDIVQVHNTMNLISPAVYYAAVNCKIPVVQTVHNFRLLCPSATFYREGHICEDCLTKGLLCAIKHSCYRGSKMATTVCVLNTWIHRRTGIYKKINYICLTEFNKNKLLKMKQIKEEQVFIKPNFVVDNAKIVPYRLASNIVNTGYFIYVGRIDKLKGLEVLLKAWKIMGDNAPNLLICGTGPLTKWCKDFLDENYIKKVFMVGLVPNEQIKALIAGAKALILPTQCYEGFPMTIAEAYSVGTPVIGSNLGNTGDLIEDGITGIKFNFEDSMELANKVIELNKNRITVPKDIRLKYSSKRNYINTMDIYTKVKRGKNEFS